MGGFTEYSSFDALGLSKLVAEGEVSATELVDEAVTRVQRINPQLNAVILPMFDQARVVAAEGAFGAPFGGVPFLLKDLAQTIKGVSTSSGSRFWRGWVPAHDGTLYRRFVDAGLITVGKTNTPEMGLLPVTEPSLFGPTRNPWDPSRSSGGSSGGSAAAVAAGVVPMASGGDGGGSIRIPASCCGVFGMKPTRARTPAGPAVSESWNGLAIEHVISRSVRDSAVCLDAIHGPERGAPYHAPHVERPYAEEVATEPGKLRVAFHADPAMPSKVHPDCVAAVHETARICESLGHEVRQVRPNHDTRALARAFYTLISANTAADLAAAERVRGRAAGVDDFETETWLTALIGRTLSGPEVIDAIRLLQTETRRLADFYKDYDVILTPTLGQPPPKIGALRAKGVEAVAQRAVVRSKALGALKLTGAVDMAVDRVFGFIPFTPVANFTGQPSMSVPLIWNRENLPIGSMFTGRFGDEATLYRLAMQLERERPWAERRPPVFAG